jgi:raffinose/stachyose/melibiose transport system permease protein
MNERILRTRRWDIAFLTPAVVMVVVFFVFPTAFIVGTSLTDWTGGTFSNVTFSGLRNYTRLFANEDFWRTMLNTLIWMLSAVVIHVPLAFLIALILYRHPPGWRVLRVVYFFPQIIAPLALAYMWIFIYSYNFGIINGILKTLGLDGLVTNWLGNPNTSLGAIIFSWLFNIGFFMVIFLSQIGTIPTELFEAAEIDGASELQKDVLITIPILKTTVGVAILLALTNTFKAFALPFIMTGGGPGVSSQILPIMMYKNMLSNRASSANAIALIMLVLGTVVVLGVMRVFRVRSEE